ncbi:MAG TPA: biotin transporter BioY, partial [Clostridiaceae bacterium]|nr:biotin transporter BioY [Clostridiaceae bacterium]
PSFGYIIGFTAAAYIIGLIIEKSRKSIISFIAANMAGIAVIYFFGVIYIYLLMNLYMGKHINMLKAISIGLAPFIIKDIIIAFVLSFICRKIYFTLKNT